MALVRSLRARVVLWVSVALVVLFALTGVVLDIAFRNNTEQARRELLEVQVLGLIALADDSSGELTLPTDAIDPQFEVANSGLYGALYADDGRAVWQSLSLLGRDFPIDYLAVAGEERFERIDVPGFPAARSVADGHHVGVSRRPRARLHVCDRAIARAVQPAAGRVSRHLGRLVSGRHADDARRRQRLVDVRAAAAASGSSGRSARSKPASA